MRKYVKVLTFTTYSSSHFLFVIFLLLCSHVNEIYENVRWKDKKIEGYLKKKGDTIQWV